MQTKYSTRSFLTTYAVVLLAPVLLLGPLLVRGQALFWGTPALQFVPWWVLAWRGLQQGSLPLWNSLNGMGAPLLANYQSAFFYPPNWLLLLFAALGGEHNAAAGVAWGYTFLAMLHLSWAGLGMALLLRRLHFRWLGQVIGGLAYGLSGYIVARLGFFSMVWVAAWLPWVLYCADQIAGPFQLPVDGRKPQKGLLNYGLTGCLAMQLLAGHAQLTWYSLLLAGAWVTVWAWQGCGLVSEGKLIGRAHRLGRAWLVFSLSALLAAGIAAVQLAPTFEYLRLSHRADAVAYDDAMTYSFWPWRFLTLFSPDFFGSPASGDFWGYASYWEDHLYLGITPLLLALASLWLLVRGLRRARRSPHWGLLAFLWAGLMITFVLALGRFTPVFPFLYKHVPTFAMFQAPARYLVWAAVALPILAAVAVESWRSPTGRGLYWFRLGTAGAFAITLGAGLAYLYMQNIRLTFIRATALTGVWALGFGLLTLSIPYARKRGWTHYWQGAVVAWTLLDLLFTGWSLNPGVSLNFYTGQSSAVQRLPEPGQRVYLSRREEYDLKFRRFLRFKDYTALEDWRGLRGTLIPDLNLLDGVSLVTNFDPLVPDRYARWVAEVETLDPAARQAWLASAGVGRQEHIDLSSAGGIRFDPVADAQRWRLFACAQRVENEQEAWTAITSFPENLPERLVVEGGAVSSCENQETTTASGTVQLIRERPDQLVLEVNSPQPGWLYLADTWYPGWQASVNGAKTSLYPANFLFRAVPIPQGVHQVVLSYRPIGFYFGGLFSILVLLFTLFQIGLRGRIQSARLPDSRI